MGENASGLEGFGAAESTDRSDPRAAPITPKSDTEVTSDGLKLSPFFGAIKMPRSMDYLDEKFRLDLAPHKLSGVVLDSQTDFTKMQLKANGRKRKRVASSNKRKPASMTLRTTLASCDYSTSHVKSFMTESPQNMNHLAALRLLSTHTTRLSNRLHDEVLKLRNNPSCLRSRGIATSTYNQFASIVQLQSDICKHLSIPNDSRERADVEKWAEKALEICTRLAVGEPLDTVLPLSVVTTMDKAFNNRMFKMAGIDLNDSSHTQTVQNIDVLAANTFPHNTVIIDTDSTALQLPSPTASHTPMADGETMEPVFEDEETMVQIASKVEDLESKGKSRASNGNGNGSRRSHKKQRPMPRNAAVKRAESMIMHRLLAHMTESQAEDEQSRLFEESRRRMSAGTNMIASDAATTDVATADVVTVDMVMTTTTISANNQQEAKQAHEGKVEALDKSNDRNNGNSTRRNYRITRRRAGARERVRGKALRK